MQPEKPTRDERVERRVRDICRTIRIEAQTPGATAAWNEVLLPVIVRSQVLAEEVRDGDA